jgi:hypothetical protein
MNVSNVLDFRNVNRFYLWHFLEQKTLFFLHVYCLDMHAPLQEQVAPLIASRTISFEAGITNISFSWVLSNWTSCSGTAESLIRMATIYWWHQTCTQLWFFCHHAFHPQSIEVSSDQYSFDRPCRPLSSLTASSWPLLMIVSFLSTVTWDNLNGFFGCR